MVRIVGRVDVEVAERVREVIRAIPAGSTLSYGEVAARAGVRSARQVGALLSEDGQDLPWHRVHRADGRFVPHLAREQGDRLRAEGVLLANGRVPGYPRGTRIR
ncbi:MGMT family protein [Pseudonocardia sp.]|uniref:MGMT family protein n=1 Tax=Pseudonocardia sp. TaxID=60912 RepID=UPI0039C9CDD9